MTKQHKSKKIEKTTSFLKELANDVEIARTRLNNDASASNLREFIRTTYAAIEAQAWNTRMYLLNDKRWFYTHQSPKLAAYLFCV
jgi:hypothetical protein